MRLTLLRAPVFPDPTGDKGEHEFTYSLLPHAGNWITANTVRAGYELNVPLLAQRCAASQAVGSLPAAKSFARSLQDNVILDTVKRAEDGSGIVLRLYESSGSKTEAALEFSFPAEGVSGMQPHGRGRAPHAIVRQPPCVFHPPLRNQNIQIGLSRQKLISQPLVDGGVNSPATATPYQFPLKSYGFPGAETARKRFLLWKMGFSAAKIAPPPPYTPPGTIKARKGFGSTIRHGRSASLASSLAALPASLGLLRAASPTGRALRAPLSRSPGIFGSLRNRVKTTTIFSQPPRNADKIHLYSELFLMKSTTSSTMQCAMQMTVSAPP